ncbi:PTS transporter subunit EIIB [Mycoplasma sp. 2248]|uniref:PTS transporter subunit EIIB n=1 Tax=Mycoplasma sp. 2248 TaxID=3108528 RepID=UPI002B1DA6F5|nr:PTS transporter subunit EIIB [Mycoplasma sp. 2248]MEA4190841.1 PTS glucose transporter subunit IIB [Mycoplasma sp. 2248]
MTKQMTKIIFLTIITLGFIWIKWKKEKKAKNTIYQSNKLPFKVEQLVSALGTKENIDNLEVKISRLVVTVKSNNKVDTEALKELKGVSGILLSSSKVSITLGEYANETLRQLEQQVK